MHARAPLTRSLAMALAVLVLVLAGWGPAPARAQTNDVSSSFSYTVVLWNRLLDDAEAYFKGLKQDDRNNLIQWRLVRSVAEQAEIVKARAAKELKDAEQLLKALGPAPKEDEPKEAESIRKRRAEYENRIAVLKAQVAQSDLALARIRALEQSASSVQLDRFYRDLTSQGPIPLLPATWAKAIPEFLAALRTLAESPLRWHESLPPQVRADNLKYWPGIVIVLLAILVSVVGRRLVLTRLGPDPAIAEPSYTRRFVAGIAAGVARGIIPALIIIGFMVWFSRPNALVTGALSDLVLASLLAALILVLASALPRALLTPNFPAWRLTDLSPEQGREICRRINLLALVFATNQFFQRALQDFDTSPELRSAFFLVMSVLQGLALIQLVRDRLWHVEPAEVAEASGEGESDEALARRLERRRKWWTFLRHAVAVAAVLAIVAAMAGYISLARYLVEPLIQSGVVIGGVLLVRGLLREGAGLTVKSTFLRQRMGISAEALKSVRFWIRSALDPVLVLLVLYIVSPYWQLPREDLTRWLESALRGFTVGSVTISILDIGVAVLVFFLAMAVTRLIQNMLQERVFPETKLDVGVQHSLATGLGYVGIMIAVALAIAALGIDLTNVALVAGALSVGIGFGLQNVVNNFVSGLILLIERPIKVGDWVVLGDKEGMVKSVNVRATEVETWQRASLIVPNAEILSSTVTNWTHKDRYGRIEVPIGVAYGSDTAKVKEILLDVARRQSKVIRYPAPNVLFMDFGDSALLFELRCFTNDVMSRLIISSEMRFEIDRRFREAGVEIPFPQRVVHMAPAAAPDAVPVPAPADDAGPKEE
ncbi:MAG: mechanosensitive ion channel family protein [Hyphomicrobiales bacterium]|nr:mechanosensitive ion channel family protein [Hyphomicrobiales bacterium]